LTGRGRIANIASTVRIRFDKNGDPTFATHVVKIVGGKETNARQ